LNNQHFIPGYVAALEYLMFWFISYLYCASSHVKICYLYLFRIHAKL